MWISRREYRDLVERLRKLEGEVDHMIGYPSVPLGKSVDMLYRQLNLTIEMPLAFPKVVKKAE